MTINVTLELRIYMVDTRHRDYKPGECSNTTVQKAGQEGKELFIFEQWSSFHTVPIAACEYKKINKQIQRFVMVVVCYKSL